jgi:hypothetical protein
MKASDRDFVRQRANECCEYCQRPQAASWKLSLQIEHVIPRSHGGGDSLDNLALACSACNLHKGPNLTGIDPLSMQLTPLFNPRTQTWGEHFVWDGVRIVGISAVGRTTIQVLDLNSSRRLRVRRATKS